MTKSRVIIQARREGYSPEQIKKTMSVRELKEKLDDFNDDDLIYLSHDNGYTYGGIVKYNIDTEEYDDDSDEECDEL